jgi:hypothetical protein
MAKISKLLLLLPLLFLFPACKSPGRDLERNEGLFPPLSYKVQHKQERSLWITPIQDRRAPPKRIEQGMFPVTYTLDNSWKRPVPLMLDGLLRREIKNSGIFRSFAKNEAEADWVLDVDLLAFHGAVEERIVGRAVKSNAILHARVYGPRGKDGKRLLLREREYRAPLETGASLILSRDPFAMAAQSFRLSLAMLISDLDQGGRLVDGVPKKTRLPGKSKETPWRAQPASAGK